MSYRMILCAACFSWKVLWHPMIEPIYTTTFIHLIIFSNDYSLFRFAVKAFTGNIGLVELDLG